MAKKIVWTPEAEESHDGVIAYLEENWTRKEVKHFLVRVGAILEHIMEHPFLYRASGKEDVREALITKHTLLLYRIVEDHIYLVYFWDTRKNPTRKP
jgi:plasmid stabilization system protein ParE